MSEVRRGAACGKGHHPFRFASHCVACLSVERAPPCADRLEKRLDDRFGWVQTLFRGNLLQVPAGGFERYGNAGRTEVLAAGRTRVYRGRFSRRVRATGSAVRPKADRAGSALGHTVGRRKSCRSAGPYPGGDQDHAAEVERTTQGTPEKTSKSSR